MAGGKICVKNSLRFKSFDASRRITWLPCLTVLTEAPSGRMLPLALPISPHRSDVYFVHTKLARCWLIKRHCVQEFS